MKKRFSKILGVALTLAMLGSLIIAPMAGAVSSPTVVLTAGPVGPPANAAYVISKLNVYTLTFNVTTAILPGTITVTFPTGTTFSAGMANTDLTLGTTGGIGQAVLPIANPAAIAFPTTNSITITPQGNIGAGAVVQIVIGNAGTAKCVLNPATPGAYTLSVATSAEATAVASQSFTLTVPQIPAVAGVVQGFNAASVKLYENTGNAAISGAIGTAGVIRVVVGPGTYDENATLAIPAGITVVSSAGAATTIISDANLGGTGGDVTIIGTALAPSVLDGFTVTGGVTATDMATVQNCVLSKAAGTALAFAGAGVTTALAPAKSIGNTISAAPAVAAGGQAGIAVAAVAAFVASTSDILNISAATVALPSAGTAITVGATGTITVTGATVTGASGTGINNSGTATVAGSTLSTLSPALSIAAGSTTTVGTSTIDACGFSSVTVPVPAILIAGAPTSLSISSSTISNSPSNILATAAIAGISAANMFINFNTLTGNVLSFDNNDTTVANYIDASNNWWGVSTGPAVASTGSVYTTPFLAAQVTNQMLATAVAAGVTTSWQTTAGVDIVTGGALPASTIAAAQYSTNPAGTIVPANVVVTKYFDVYRRGAAGIATDFVTVRFYGVQSNLASVYAFSNAQGIWVLASGQAVDPFRGCVTVTITNASTPNISNLTGLAFALVEPSTAITTVPVAPAIGMPAFGEQEAPIRPTFTWTASATATSYEFVLAEEIGQDDKFAIIDYSATTNLPGHKAREQLKYDTVYNWRVRAVNAIGAGAWTTGFFTTVTEPVPEPEPIPPVIIKEMPPTPAPEIILNVPPATKQEVQVIPDYLLWVVVAVGAVLIIAVVVLIVRTRRVI